MSDVPDREPAPGDRRQSVEDNGIEPAGSPSPSRNGVPKDLAYRYTAHTTMLGGTWFYHDAHKREFAFRDRGDRLTTRAESPAVVKDLVAIAAHRGWQEIQGSGTATFQRQLWIEASLIGLKVRGYQPSEPNRAALETTAHQPARDPSAGVELTGKLIDVGSAPYADIKGNDPSSFATIEHRDGTREKVWGAGLPTDLSAAGAKPGDEIVIRRATPTQVSVHKTSQEHKPRQAKKAIQKTGPIERREESPTRQPKLTREALSQLRVVAAAVEANIKDPEQRAALLDLARGYMAKELAKGHSFPTAAVRNTPAPKRERPAVERTR